MDIRPLENYPVRGAPQTPGGDTQVVETRPAPAVRGVDPEGTPAQAPAAQGNETAARRKPDISKVAAGMNTVLENNGNHLRFVVHDKAGRMMVQIRDNKTEEVIRTIPSEQLLDLAAKIDELIGLLVDKKT